MAQAGSAQAKLVQNILTLIHGLILKRIYAHDGFYEAIINPGKGHYVLYSSEAEESDVLVTGRDIGVNLDVERAMEAVWGGGGREVQANME
jgi:hypothetical protein